MKIKTLLLVLFAFLILNTVSVSAVTEFFCGINAGFGDIVQVSMAYSCFGLGSPSLIAGPGATVQFIPGSGISGDPSYATMLVIPGGDLTINALGPSTLDVPGGFPGTVIDASAGTVTINGNGALQVTGGIILSGGSAVDNTAVTGTVNVIGDGVQITGGTHIKTTSSDPPLAITPGTAGHTFTGPLILDGNGGAVNQMVFDFSYSTFDVELWDLHPPPVPPEPVPPVKVSGMHNDITVSARSDVEGRFKLELLNLLYSIIRGDFSIGDGRSGIKITDSYSDVFTDLDITNADTAVEADPSFNITIANSTFANSINCLIIDNSSTLVYNVTFMNCSSHAVNITNGSSNNEIRNSTFINNTIGVGIYGGSYNNTIYWNRFMNLSTPWSYFAFDGNPTAFNNSFNISVGGKAQGNYWADVFDKSLQIYDTDGDGFGNAGAQYPYMDLNGGNVSGVRDYGPRAPTNVGPNVTFVSQIPPDITSFNILSTILNITYGITDINGIVNSSVLLYYKTNSSISDCWAYINGSIGSCGYKSRNYSSATGSNYSFELRDNQVYPATYIFEETALEYTPHSSTVLSNTNQPMKIRFFNVSNSAQYGFFEVMTNTSGTGALRVYYCNSSYTSGTVTSNNNCINFYNLNASAQYNHSHPLYSKHQVIPFAINTTSGTIGNVKVTPTSYFVLRTTLGTNWDVYYISNISRPDTVQTSSNLGVTWSNFSGTVDSHLHQYNGNDTFHYYACANNTLNISSCSSARFDLINQSGIPPTSPNVYSPTNVTYSGNIPINYTASLSPNGYSIRNYNISLLNSDYTFNKTIQSNNSLNLSYLWDSSSTATGTYVIKVEVCDVMGLCSFGLSEQFQIGIACGNISTSTTLTQNYSSNGTCFTITASNVVLDCAKYIIKGNTSGYGILALSNLQNITVKNCTLLNFTVGIGFNQTNNSFALNNNASGITLDGILLYAAHNNNLTNNIGVGLLIQIGPGVFTSIGRSVVALINSNYNSLYNNRHVTRSTFPIPRSNNSIYMQNSNYNNLTINSASDTNMDGYYLNNSNYNLLTGNLADKTGMSGFYLFASHNNTFTNNRLGGNYLGQEGFDVRSSENNTFTGNNISDPGANGFYLLNSNNNDLFRNKVLRAGSSGFYINSSNSSYLESDTAGSPGSGSGSYGYELLESTDCVFLNNTDYDGGSAGFYLDNVDNSNFTNNTAEPFYDGFEIWYGSSRNRFEGNVINATNGWNCFDLFESNNNTLINNILKDCANDGIAIYSSNYTSVIDTPPFNSSNFDINVTSSIEVLLSDYSFNPYSFSNAGLILERNPVGMIRFLNTSITESKSSLVSDVNFNANLIRINSTNAPGLNQSANLSFYVITAANPEPIWDPEDDGSFVPCPANICTELSYIGTTYIYNVTQFSGFSSGNGSTPPTQDTPILNSTYGTNTTAENLTVWPQNVTDIDNDSVTNISNWYLNGTSITVLNMPFDTNSSNTTRDYSPYENNGTVNGSTWTSSGILGGAYVFDGVNDYIRVPGDATLDFNDTAPMTIEAWVKPSTQSTDGRIVSKEQIGTGTGYFLTIDSAQWPYYFREVSPYWVLGTTQLNLNQWNHLAVTFNGTVGTIYVNGVKSGNTTFTAGINSNTSFPLMIGSHLLDNGSVSTLFNGSIDEVRIYNRSLNASQIRANYNTGAPNYLTIVSQELRVNDTWHACLTPNDGLLDGITKCSNNVTGQAAVQNVTGGEWRMFRRWLNHTAWDGVNYQTIPKLYLEKIYLGADVASSPAIANGYAYVGSYALTSIYQLNATNISIQIANFTPSAISGGTFSSPAVVGDYLYIGDSNGYLFQLNASNISRHIANYSTGDVIYTSPSVADGYVYVGNDNRTVFQLSAANVSQVIAKFIIASGSGAIFRSSPAVNGGYVYIGSGNGRLFQLNSSNIAQQIANFTVGAGGTSNAIWSSPAVANGYVYVGSRNDRIYQLNASNISQQIANFTTGNDITYSSPAVANGYVYIGSMDNNVYQLNASNISQQIANFTTALDVIASPTVAGDYVYIGVEDSVIYKLNASNISQQIANFTTGNAIDSSAAYAPDGSYVYFGSNDDYFYQYDFNYENENISLIINKTDNPDPVYAGNLLNYTINYFNNGTVSITNFVIVETYPPEVTFISAVPPPDPGTNDTWTIGTVANGTGGTINITVLVNSSVANNTNITNWVNFSFYDSLGQDFYENSTNETTLVLSHAEGLPSMTINKTDDPDPVYNGNYLNYTINYCNNGNVSAGTVTITEMYDANVTYFNATPQPTNPNDVWIIGTVLPGVCGTINITVLVNDSIANNTNITNIVNISYKDIHSNYYKGNYTEITLALRHPEPNNPRLIVNKTDDPDPVYNGTYLNYTITYCNNGTDNANSIFLNETYDANVAYVNASPLPAPGTNNTWSLPTVDPGNCSTVNITVLVNPAIANNTNITNVVNMTYLNASGDLLRAGDTERTLALRSPEPTPPTPTPSGGGGGGGGATRRYNTSVPGPQPTVTPAACFESWICDEWSACENNMQIRSCIDLKNCGTTNVKPDESRSCTIPPAPVIEAPAAPVPEPVIAEPQIVTPTIEIKRTSALSRILSYLDNKNIIRAIALFILVSALLYMVYYWSVKHSTTTAEWEGKSDSYIKKQKQIARKMLEGKIKI